MCRAGGRRCRGASTSKAAARERQRRRREARRADGQEAANPNTAGPVDTSHAAPGGDVTPEQPQATQHTDTMPGQDNGVGPVTGEGNLVLVSPRGPLHISMSGSGSGPEVVAGDVTPARARRRTSGADRKASPASAWDRERREDEQRAIRQAAEASGRTEREVLEELESLMQRIRGARQGDVTARPATNARTARRADQARRDTEREQARIRNRSNNNRTINVVGDGHITITGQGDVTR